MICGDCWIYADDPFCTPESHESVQKLIKSEQKSDFFHQYCLLFDSGADNTVMEQRGAAQKRRKQNDLHNDQIAGKKSK